MSSKTVQLIPQPASAADRSSSSSSTLLSGSSSPLSSTTPLGEHYMDHHHHNSHHHHNHGGFENGHHDDGFISSMYSQTSSRVISKQTSLPGTVSSASALTNNSAAPFYDLYKEHFTANLATLITDSMSTAATTAANSHHNQHHHQSHHQQNSANFHQQHQCGLCGKEPMLNGKTLVGCLHSFCHGCLIQSTLNGRSQIQQAAGVNGLGSSIITCPVCAQVPNH